MPIFGNLLNDNISISHVLVFPVLICPAQTSILSLSRLLY